MLVVPLLAGIATARGADVAPSPIAVVVGRQSFVTATSLDELRDLYLRRKRVWANGARAVPINLPAGHPIRERFSTLVLGRSAQDLVSYWDARYFEGITPPTVLPSVAAVRAYLAAEPAAIAYVPLTDVGETCRVLVVLDHAATGGAPAAQGRAP